DDLLHVRPLLVEHLGAAPVALDADRVDVRPDRLEALRALVHLRPPPPSPRACPRSPGPPVSRTSSRSGGRRRPRRRIRTGGRSTPRSTTDAPRPRHT